MKQLEKEQAKVNKGIPVSKGYYVGQSGYKDNYTYTAVKIDKKQDEKNYNTYKGLFYLILFMPLISMAQQQTYVPDDNFEAALEYMGIGNGISNDDFVTTSNISDITNLLIYSQGIADLTGIEDFLSLRGLSVQDNQLTNIDLSNNTALKILDINDNQLTQLDLSNNPLIEVLHAFNNPGLECINVYDITQANTWYPAVLDNNQYFSESCMLTDVAETYQYRRLVKIIDLWGNDVVKYNQAVFFIYDDGSVERKVIIQ